MFLSELFERVVDAEILGCACGSVWSCDVVVGGIRGDDLEGGMGVCGSGVEVYFGEQGCPPDGGFVYVIVLVLCQC